MTSRFETAALWAVAGGLLAGAAGAAGPALPPPPGGTPLGTVGEVWVDRERPETLTGDPDDRRELRVRIWYPSTGRASGGQAPPAPYVLELDRLAPHFGADRTARYRSVATSARLGELPDLEGGPYPVVLFSHGKGMVGAFYSALLERLAAGGRAVVAIDHPFGAEAVAVEGGRVIPFDPRWDEMEPPEVPIEEVFRFTEERSELWAADVRFVLDRLGELAAPGSGWILEGALDLRRVAAVGHSLGGKAAALSCRREPRLAACVDLDGWPLHREVEAEGLDQPFLLIEDYRDVSEEELAGWGAERSQYVTNMRALQRRKDELFSRMPPESAHVMLRGIRHGSFTDFPLLWPSERDAAATRDPVEALEMIADHLEDFLDEHLEGRDTDLFHPAAFVRIYGPLYEPPPAGGPPP